MDVLNQLIKFQNGFQYCVLIESLILILDLSVIMHNYLEI